MTELVGRLWPEVTRGSIELSAQNHSQATYYPRRFEADGEINWSWCATDVYNFVRAQTHPYRCAYSFLGGKKVRIRSCRMVVLQDERLPGVAELLADGSVLISCGDRSGILVERENLLTDEGLPLIDDPPTLLPMSTLSADSWGRPGQSQNQPQTRVKLRSTSESVESSDLH